MSEPSPVRRRTWWKLLLGFCVLSVIALGLLGWYATTDSFQQMIRRRLIAALEQTTGGRAEVGEFHTIPFRLRVEVRDLTIHGREGKGEVPFFRVDRLQAELKIVSLLSRIVRLHSLILEHPVTHVIVYPDGSTNAPAPRVTGISRKGPLEDLVALSVSSIEVEHGEVFWQQERIPLDFAARDVALRLQYSFLHQHYQAELTVGSARTRFLQYPALEWRSRASLILARDHAELTDLTAISDKSELHVSGSVRDFHHPRIAGGYRGTIDALALAAFLGQSALRRGSAQLEGQGTWSLEDFSTQGTISARDLEWSEGPLKSQNGRLTAKYSLTPRRLQISSLKAALFAGELQGGVDIVNWQTPPSLAPIRGRPRTGQVSAAAPQRGTLRLQLSGLSITPAVAALSTRKVPLSRLNLIGSVSGTVDMTWVGTVRDADARGNLTLSAPERAQSGLLPVRGLAAGVYRGSRDELTLDRFQIRTRSSEIEGSGSLSATSSLRISFNSHDLNEWKPLLEAAYGSEHLPFAVHGWGKFQGTASGRLSALAWNGNLEAYDFDTDVPVTSPGAEQRLHWDALTVGIQYSRSGVTAHNGVLIHGRSVARFNGSLALVNGIEQPTSPLALELEVRGADLAEAARVAGTKYPISGVADLSLRASGTRLHPHGEGRLEIHDAQVYQTPIPFLRSAVTLDETEVQFTKVETSVYGAPVSGDIVVGLESRQFRMSLTGRDLDLARFPRLETTRFAIDGKVDFTAHANGTLEQPSLEAHVHFRDLAFDKERAGDFFVDALTRGGKLEIQAHSEFEQADLKLGGTVTMDDGYPADLDIAFRNLDLDYLLNAYLPARTTGHSRLAGSLRVHGPLRSWRDLSLTGDLDSVDAEVAHVRLHNAEPVRFEVADHVLSLEQMRMSGTGTDFRAHGRARLFAPGEMDFRLEGTAGMDLLQMLNPKISSRGVMEIRLNVEGTRASPVLQGRLELKDTYIGHSDLPSGLSNLNGVMVFDQNRIQIEKLTGNTGGGTVELSGSASYQKGELLLDVGARAREVRLRYPPGTSSTANANLRLSGSANSALLSGTVAVTKLGVNPGFDFGAYAERSKHTGSSSGSESLESRLKLDVHIVTAPELQMQTAIAKLSGSADLRVRGTVDRPVVTGRVNANEGGQLSFNGTKYNLERMEVTLSNPAKTQPVIDLRASTRVRDYDITVSISGDLSAPNALKPTWHSEPPLPEADVIALLALGRTTEETAAGQGGSGNFGGEMSNLILNQALNSTVTSRMQRLFGVSRIKIDPQGVTSETTLARGPQVTIEQQVANNITITYSTNVSVTSQQIIQFEYNMTRNISIVAMRDQNGVVSFDLKIRQRKK